MRLSKWVKDEEVKLEEFMKLEVVREFKCRSRNDKFSKYFVWIVFVLIKFCSIWNYLFFIDWWFGMLCL